jgi:transposase
MARAYSDDLRRKLLEAHEQGEGTLPELAVRFRVSEGWANKISSVFHRTGEMVRPTGARRGPPCRITQEQEKFLRSIIRIQPDLTLAELQANLRRERGITISVSRLWTILKRMGLRLKKSHSMQPNRTLRPSAHNANSGGRQQRKSTRGSSSSSTKAASRRK